MGTGNYLPLTIYYSFFWLGNMDTGTETSLSEPVPVHFERSPSQFVPYRYVGSKQFIDWFCRTANEIYTKNTWPSYDCCEECPADPSAGCPQMFRSFASGPLYRLFRLLELWNSACRGTEDGQHHMDHFHIQHECHHTWQLAIHRNML